MFQLTGVLLCAGSTVLQSSNRMIWDESQPEADYFNDYRDWGEFNAFKHHLKSKHPNRWISQTISPGTHNGESLEFLTISGGQSPMTERKAKGEIDNLPGIYIQALVHAREWEGISMYTPCPLHHWILIFMITVVYSHDVRQLHSVAIARWIRFWPGDHWDIGPYTNPYHPRRQCRWYVSPQILYWRFSPYHV